MSEIQSGANNTFQRATQLQREGRLEEAIALYREAIEKNPNFAWYYHDLGEALIALGDPKEAIECYRKAVEISPESGWFNNRLSFRLATKTRLDSNWIVTLDKYEKKIYSQSGEDGIIERIFEKIGIINKLAVEFGEPNGGKNSCTANLRINHGWKTILFDKSPKSDLVHPAIITAKNINSLFKKYGVTKCFDLLSIDIDGNDYWVWKAIDDSKFKPRVVMIEFNCNFPIYKSKTIEYNPKHKYEKTKYYGASLAALDKLGRSKGYSLIYHTGPLNAFFVLTDLLPADCKELEIEDIFHPPDIESFGSKWGFGKPTWFDAPNPEKDPAKRNWVEV